MKVQSRLVLAFTYIIVVVVIAFEVPLAVNLYHRTIADVESSAITNALIIAQTIGAEQVKAATSDTSDPTALARSDLQKWVRQNFPHTLDGRLIVVDVNGILIADSMGSTHLGELYATPLRPELQKVLNSQAPYSEIRYSDTLREDILVAAAPILDEGSLYGAVRRSEGVGYVHERVVRVISGLIVIGFAALLAGLVIAFALAGSLSRPLSRLAAAATRLGRGDLTVRTAETSGASEIRELSDSFDEMADRLQATVKAQHEFVGNASHQLRTPLTGMKLRLESAMEETEPAEQHRQLEAADAEVDRLAEIVERLLVMARRIEKGGPAEVDIGEGAARAVDRWEERANRAGASLTTRGEGGRALGDGADIDQIFDNLIDNAVSHAPGPIVIETGLADGLVFLAVEDRGSGIAPDERHRVTERFFRGKGAPSGGSGLGLAIVRELAEKWGGSVAIGSPPEGGTRVEVRLPPAGGDGSAS